jgi:hypothetical protein
MYFIKFIIFHFHKAYLLNTLVLVSSAIIFYIFLNQINSEKKIQKTIGFLVLCHFVVFWNKSFSSSIGTGSFVSPNIIITNEHVADNSCLKIMVIDKNHQYEADYIDGEKNNKIDLSFLKVRDIDQKVFLRVSTERLKIGEQIFFPDYDINNLGHLDKATGTLTAYLPNNHLFVKSSRGRPGNSGSPFINNEGALVGVLYGGKGYFSKIVNVKGSGGDAVGNSVEQIIYLAKKNKIKLYQAPKIKYFNKTLEEFIDDVSVSIHCIRVE